MSHVTDDTKKTQQKSRRHYKEPHLIVYGAVKDLTAGGSGKNSEGGDTKFTNKVFP